MAPDDRPGRPSCCFSTWLMVLKYGFSLLSVIVRLYIRGQSSERPQGYLKPYPDRVNLAEFTRLNRQTSELL